MKLCFDESLREYFPAEIEVQASSAFDALSLIAHQHPMYGKIEPIPMRFKEFMSYEIATDPSLTDKVFTLTRVDDLSDVKGYRGSGQGRGRAVVMIVVAVALIVVTHGASAGSTTASATSSAFMSTTGASLAVNSVIMNIGVQLLIAGLMGLLSPNKRDDKETSKASYGVGGGINTTEVGTPIQFILGRHLASAQVLSFNISTNSNFNGVDDPDGSPYFKSKSDTNLPTINNDKFYGLIRAGDTTKILHQDASIYTTGTEIQ